MLKSYYNIQKYDIFLEMGITDDEFFRVGSAEVLAVNSFAKKFALFLEEEIRIGD